MAAVFIGQSCCNFRHGHCLRRVVLVTVPRDYVSITILQFFIYNQRHVAIAGGVNFKLHINGAISGHR